MKIWTYNLVTFEIKEEEVDIIKTPTYAKRGRTVFQKFKETEDDAFVEVINFLLKEIDLRENRLNKLKESLKKISNIYYERPFNTKNQEQDAFKNNSHP